MNVFEQVLESVLARSKYDVLTGRSTTLTERITQLVYRFIEFILEKLNLSFDPAGLNINPVMLKNLFLILGTVIVVIIAGIIVSLVFRAKSKKSVSGDIFSQYRENTLSVSQLLALAQSSAGGGDYPAALRYQYIALIKCFDDNNIIYITDSMTGGQFRRAVQAAVPQFVTGVDSTVDLFYRLWFGKKAVTPDIFDNHCQLFNAMIKEADRFEQQG